MGIIMGALGGLGEAAGNVGSTMLKNELDTESKLKVGQQDSDLALQRAKALEDYKVSTANQQREAQAGRIGAAAQPIIDDSIIAKARAARGNQLPAYDPNADATPSFHGDAAQVLASINALPDGPDKQAALAQLQQQVKGNRAAVGNLTSADLTDDEKTKFAPSDADVQKARTRAAIQTGDISPTEAAKLASSSEITQMKMDSLLARADDRNATMKEVAEARADALKYGYELRLQAAQEKRINGKVDSATSRMLITSEDANIRASTSQINILNNQLTNVSPGKNGDAQRAQIKSQMDDLRTEIAESKKRKLDLFKGLNIVPQDEEGGDDSPAPAAAPAAPAASSTKPPLSSFMK